jgi:hypothetical protein
VHLQNLVDPVHSFTKFIVTQVADAAVSDDVVVFRFQARRLLRTISGVHPAGAFGGRNRLLVWLMPGAVSGRVMRGAFMPGPDMAPAVAAAPTTKSMRGLRACLGRLQEDALDCERYEREVGELVTI